MSFSQPQSAPLHSPEPSPRRAEWWQLGDRRLRLADKPLLMGILNVTPDSFSDGGKFVDPKLAIEQGLQLAADGADILDIGGESTRPYSDPVGTQQEIDRVMPVLSGLLPHLLIPVSIDTSKARVAREAVAAGARIINDVTALQGDPQMIELAAGTQTGLCVMHMRGTPQTMQDNPMYDDVVGEVFEFLCARRDALRAAGIRQDRIALDPGIGFGKTHQHNLALVKNCYRFHALGCPLLVGHSRKAFIRKLLGDQAADTGAGTVGAAIALADQGVQILRVHDVRAVRDALELYRACRPTGGRSVDPK